MQITVPVNHNFHEESPIKESALTDAFHACTDQLKCLKEIFSSVNELNTGNPDLKKVKIVSLKQGRHFTADNNRLILKMYSKEKKSTKEYYIQTGLYAGVIFHKGCKINISSRYGDILLHRMLNFVLDIFIDCNPEKAQKQNIENPYLHIIKYLFVQSLEKAAILGIPQEYKRDIQRSSKLRGNINIAEYIKRDIPFQGKITSVFNERKYVQEIVDVLHVAIKKIENFMSSEDQKRLLGIIQLLQQEFSGYYPSHRIIEKAKNNPSFNNPMYAGFRNVLRYAEIILQNDGLTQNKQDNQLSTHGYLFDIAELFEIYLEKLLSRGLENWNVTGQENLALYHKQFYRRSMFPDIVLKHKVNNKIAVFDVKFKKMEMVNADVDRNDLHQIHSYAGFYNTNLVLAGLLYPFTKEVNTHISHSKHLYGNEELPPSFIIDGIHVNALQNFNSLKQAEISFIERIKSLLAIHC
ncbi:hypothetical protein GCM10007424_00270 [Flavobacterium suaedae]|uniref:Restriction endonuclease n=1 Tax=Flavobacterium suaedae TaxID=1767027 RepID=A0ABQ1JEI8_9FLAO|nr:hypothetical protein [Flavobacterium suaedae]GGB64344.1 hypothetical protein GCM10007424_00270 [Flavobacterium suaedae]